MTALSHFLKESLILISLLALMIGFSNREGFAQQETKPPQSTNGSSVITEMPDETNQDENLSGIEEVFDDQAENELNQLDETAFDETNPDDTTKDPSEVSNQSDMELGGYFKESIGYNTAHKKPEEGNTDWRGLSRLGTELRLEIEMKFTDSWKVFISGKAFYDYVYQYKGENEYTDPVMENYQQEVELWKAYITGSLSKNFDLKTGRQIVVWGKSDSIRITDILNPINVREIGTTDLEDIRLPLTMTKIDAYFGSWNISTIAIHEVRFNKTPKYGSDYYFSDSPPPEEDIPDHGGENMEYAFAINGSFGGWDLSFYYADVLNDTAHLELNSEVAQTGGQSNLIAKHARIEMVGAAFNIVDGVWLFKSEVAFLSGLKYFKAPNETYQRIDALIGMEYSGFNNMNISLETANRQISNYDEKLEAPPDNAQENETQTVIRIMRDFNNDTLHLIVNNSSYGKDGRIFSVSLDYDLFDSLNIAAKYIDYLSGDQERFKRMADNDRFLLNLKYSF